MSSRRRRAPAPPAPSAKDLKSQKIGQFFLKQCSPKRVTTCDTQSLGRGKSGGWGKRRKAYDPNGKTHGRVGW